MANAEQPAGPSLSPEDALRVLEEIFGPLPLEEEKDYAPCIVCGTPTEYYGGAAFCTPCERRMAIEMGWRPPLHPIPDPDQ